MVQCMGNKIFSKQKFIYFSRLRNMKITWFVIVYVAQIAVCLEHDFKGFDDSILFGINWPGSLEHLIEGTGEREKINQGEVLKVQTANKEWYQCHIPDVIVSEPMKIEDYEGPSPIELLKPLFTQKICSYRLESYWSYEVCHGRYVRQYHEEREGKQIKVQEYYLGHWTAEKQKELEASQTASKERQEKPRLTKVDGNALPYVEMVMEDGTLCDLNNKPRLTRLQYVCYSHGKHEVYSFKETATCEYEIIVLSPLLCDHPQFKPKEARENAVTCLPVGEAPKKPRSLLAMEAEGLRLQHQTIRLTSNDKDAKDVVAVLKVEKIEKDGETHLKFELHPLTEEPHVSDVTTAPRGGQGGAQGGGGEAGAGGVPVMRLVDDSPVRAFLNGDNCLNGGTGWWKYEFCYGKHVAQYHIDRAGEKTSVQLGHFEPRAHLDWIKENKAKAPKPLDQRTSISHLYSGGDICDKTGKPRQTEVKLKCLENSSNSAQVSLYLLEPRTCHYILGVESPLICDILPFADENGLINMSTPLTGNEPSEDRDKEDVTFVNNDAPDHDEV